MKYFFTTLVLISLFFTNGHGQDLYLTSGKKTKTIKVGTYIDVQIPLVIQGVPHDEGRKYISGKLISYESGVLKLRRLTSRNPFLVSESNKALPYKEGETAEGIRYVEITRDSVLSITKKGTKKRRKYTSGNVVGQVLVTFGVSHLLSAPVAELQEENTGGLFLFLGLGEVVTGSVLISVFRQKPIYTNEIWAFNKAGRKVWDLN